MLGFDDQKYDKYSRVSNESTTDVTDVTDIDTFDTSRIDRKKLVKPRKISDIKNPKGLWKWFIQKPFERWHIIIYTLSFSLAILFLVFYITGDHQIYTPSGVIGLLLCMFAFNHFRLLLGLKEEVDTFAKQNMEFQIKNDEIKAEVDRLKKAVFELTNTKKRLSNVVSETAENLNKFEELNTTMDAIGKNNIQGLDQFRKGCQKIERKWREELRKNERELLFNVFNRTELMDKQAGMNKEEYNAFLDALPAKYQLRFTKSAPFDKIAVNGIIDIAVFAGLLDHFAEFESRTYDLQFIKQLSINNNGNNNDNNNGNHVNYTYLKP